MLLEVYYVDPNEPTNSKRVEDRYTLTDRPKKQRASLEQPRLANSTELAAP
jgi:hypothetical protein